MVELTSRERLTASARSEAQAHLQRVLMHVPTALLVVDFDLEVITANPAFSTLTGWAGDEATGLMFAELFGRAMHGRLANAADDGWSAPRAFVRHPSGGLGKPVALGASLIRTPSGHGVWLVRVAPRSLSARSDPDAPRAPASPAQGETALQRLAETVRQGGTKLGACHVRVVGLQRAREIAGPRWPRIQRRIAILCETTIARELGPDDVFTMTETGDYLIAFNCGEADEADRRAARLNGEIERRLLGEGSMLHGRSDGAQVADQRALAGIGVDVRSGAVGADQLANGGNLLDQMANRVALNHGGRSSLLDLHLDWLAGYRGIAFHPLETPEGAGSTLLRLRLDDPRIAEMATLAARDDRVAEVAATLDCRRLELLRDALDRGAVDRRSVIVDVHLASLESRRHRRHVFEQLRLLGEYARSWLVPNVVGIAPATYRGRVQDAVFMLKPWSRAQTLSLSPQDLATMELAQLPCRLFLLDARNATFGDGLAARIADRLAKVRARLILEGSKDRALIGVLRPNLVVDVP